MTVREVEPTPDEMALARRLIAERGVDAGSLVVGRADVLVLVALAAEHGGRVALAETRGARHCRVCGCQELDACRPEPCWWVARDLCSVCEPFVEELS